MTAVVDVEKSAVLMDQYELLFRHGAAPFCQRFLWENACRKAGQARGCGSALRKGFLPEFCGSKTGHGTMFGKMQSRFPFCASRRL